MWGPSYSGYVQWAVAPGAPAFLKAIVPSIGASEITPYNGGAFTFDGMVRWVNNLSRVGGTLKLLMKDFFRYLYPAPLNRMLNRAFAALPISEADERLVGVPVAYYRKWLLPENAHFDAPFWRSVAYGARMSEVRAATHFIGGWYDIFLHQSLLDYAALCAAGQSPYLTIGPWKHLALGCVAESLRSGIAWFDAQLKAGRRRLRAKPVRLFLMGANAWREYDQFPVAARETRIYLRAHGQLGAASPAAHFAPDRYRFDPSDPTPALGGPLYSPMAGAIDNRVLEARSDVLTYTTPPLQNEVEVIGRVRLELYARSTAPSFDIFARLCAVHPDGRSINLCDGLTRVDSGVGEKQADGSVRLVVDMWATANRFLHGHRIRLMVASGAHPRFARNLGTGEPLATATRMIVAAQTIYHDTAHPSALILPIAGESA